MLVDEAGINDHCDEDEKSEAVAPFDAAAVPVFAAVGEVDDGGDEVCVVDDNEDQYGGAVDGSLIPGI